MTDAPTAEQLDLVDGCNRVIGRAARSEVHGTPALAHRAVHVLVRNSAGNLFLQQRSPTKDIQPGKWDSSVGGHVAAGESYTTAARRELGEELGRDAAPTALRYLHEYVWRSSVETEHVRTYELFDEGPFQLHRDEIAAGRFWAPDELRGAIGGDELTPNLTHELTLLNLG